MTQCEQIIREMKRGWQPTVLSALRSFGVMALSQRCTELRARGWPIVATLILLPSGKRVARYRLKKRGWPLQRSKA